MATSKSRAKPTSRSKPRAARGPARGAGVPPLAAEVAALMAKHPSAMREALLRLRAQVFAAAPGADETVAWRMPMITFGGKHLVGYEAFKAHCSLFPMSSGAIASLTAALGDRVGGRGTIHFTPEDPLPPALVKRLVKLRLGELGAKAAAAKAKKAKRPAP